MGYNATVVVLLDRLDEIERDKDFGKKLCDAIRHRGAYGEKKGYDPASEATGQTQVIEVHHADHQMVIAVGGNCGQVLGYGGSYRCNKEEIVKNLARQVKAEKKSKPAPLTPNKRGEKI